MVSVLQEYFRDSGSSRWSLFVSLAKETDTKELNLWTRLDMDWAAPNQAQQVGWTR